MTADERLAFAPSPRRGQAIDGAIRADFARSLEAVYARIGGAIHHDPTRLGALLDLARRQPLRPAAFALYTDLVEAILADDLGEAQAISDQLLDLPATAAAETRIVTLSDDDLGAGQAARYARLVNDDPDNPTVLRAVTEGKAAVNQRIAAALALIDCSAPDYGGELRAILREIVMVIDDEDRFDGASTLYLWGAILLSLGAGSERVDLAQALIHESTHMLLFGMTSGRPLVENDPEERFSSPLRMDPRPMEGVVHAAYVLARMHDGLARLAAGGGLTDQERERAEAELGSHRERFFAVLEPIERHARFNPAGKAIFGGAVAYMRGAAGAGATA